MIRHFIIAAILAFTGGGCATKGTSSFTLSPEDLEKEEYSGYPDNFDWIHQPWFYFDERFYTSAECQMIQPDKGIANCTFRMKDMLSDKWFLCHARMTRATSRQGWQIWSHGETHCDRNDVIISETRPFDHSTE